MAVRVDQDEPRGQSVHKQAAAVRESFSTAVEQGQPFDQALPPSVFAMMFATSKSLLERLNAQGRSIIFEIISRKPEVRVVIVTPKRWEVNLVQAMHDNDYRTGLVAGWYWRLVRAYQNPNERQACAGVTSVFTQAAQPLGLVSQEGVPLPGMFDLAYPPDQRHPVRAYIDTLRELVAGDALRTPENIHEGIIQAIESLWGILETTAPVYTRQNQDRSPEIIRSQVAFDGIHPT